VVRDKGQVLLRTASDIRHKEIRRYSSNMSLTVM